MVTENFTIRKNKLDVIINIDRPQTKQKAEINYKGDLLFFGDMANPIRDLRKHGIQVTIFDK